MIFRNSSLEKIPDEVSILKVIKNADFSENKLMHLGLQNSTCALLRTLNVDFNNITIIRRGDLDCFSNLITLSITNNGLKTIEPGAFNKNLKHFRRLNAQFNGLVSLDTSLVAMLDEPRQANLVLITYASSEGSGELAHPRSLARTFAARSYKQ